MGATTGARHLAGDLWGGFAAMTVALPSAIAFGVTLLAPLGPHFDAQGAVAGLVGAIFLGLIAAPSAPRIYVRCRQPERKPLPFCHVRRV